MEQLTFDSAALCECGCGEPAPIARQNDPRRGYVKGRPVRFVKGHNARKRLWPDGTPQARGAASRRKLFVEVGQRIGRGVVTEIDLTISRKSGQVRAARLICDDGNEYVAPIAALVGKRPENQRRLSCGCLRRERQIAAVTKHGMSSRVTPHPLIKIWSGMIHRCESPDDVAYCYYGAQGVKVCERWHDPVLFAEDIERECGPRPEGWTLDRYPDPCGNYEPGNVRWASDAMQAANKRPRDPAAVSAGARKMWETRDYLTYTCEHCGGEYQTRALSADQKFCSKKCKAAARRASGVDSEQRTCHQCSGSFTCNRYDKTRHCSSSCAATCQHAGGCP